MEEKIMEQEIKTEMRIIDQLDSKRFLINLQWMNTKMFTSFPTHANKYTN